ATDRYWPGLLKTLGDAGIFFEAGKDAFPNIVSSYVTEGVFSKSAWVSEGLYKDILEGFDHRPELKINLVEGGQSFVPFFTGHLNFISSSLQNHWHLFLRRPGTNELYQWSTAIYSSDIPRVSKWLGELIAEAGFGNAGANMAAKAAANAEPIGPAGNMATAVQGWGERLQLRIAANLGFAGGPGAPELRLPAFRLPYYEGFNRYGNKYWLGIYRREEMFPVSFLKDLCLICRKSRIGQLYTTPWKSLLIKGIEEADLPLWEYVLGKYRMNIRHASNELNWQVEDLSAEGLRLKRYLVRQLDQDDIRTEGLSFVVKLQRGSGLPGSVVIRKQAAIRPGQWKMLDRYELWHTADFDPNSRDLELYRKDLEKEMLHPYLVSLCKEFYSLQSGCGEPELEEGMRFGGSGGPTTEQVLECRDCLTQYHPAFGDPLNGIAAGTAIDQLDSGYSCPVCGAPRDQLDLVEKIVPVRGQS
ncbi:MAG TPA: rubredoxin, partial [Puia sp.]|nr:rubredoxin [Puia sp.]